MIDVNRAKKALETARAYLYAIGRSFAASRALTFIEAVLPDLTVGTTGAGLTDSPQLRGTLYEVERALSGYSSPEASEARILVREALTPDEADRREHGLDMPAFDAGLTRRAFTAARDFISRRSLDNGLVERIDSACKVMDCTPVRRLDALHYREILERAYKCIEEGSNGGRGELKLLQSAAQTFAPALPAHVLRVGESLNIPTPDLFIADAPAIDIDAFALTLSNLGEDLKTLTRSKKKGAYIAGVRKRMREGLLQIAGVISIAKNLMESARILRDQNIDLRHRVEDLRARLSESEGIGRKIAAANYQIDADRQNLRRALATVCRLSREGLTPLIIMGGDGATLDKDAAEDLKSALREREGKLMEVYAVASTLPMIASAAEQKRVLDQIDGVHNTVLSSAPASMNLAERPRRFAFNEVSPYPTDEAPFPSPGMPYQMGVDFSGERGSTMAQAAKLPRRDE